MTFTIEATFENGLLKPKQPLALAEGAEVRLTIHPADAEELPPDPNDPLEAVIGICDSRRADGADQPDKYLPPLSKSYQPPVEDLPPDPNDPLEAVIGIGDGLGDGADNHDKYICRSMKR